MTLADPDDVAAGLLFHGRIAEDFKLSTGTFVSVGTLRPKLISASHGLLTDAVICGESGDEVTALVWLHPDHAGRCDDDGVPDDGLRADWPRHWTGWPRPAADRPSGWSGCWSSASHPRWMPGRSPTRAT